VQCSQLVTKTQEADYLRAAAVEAALASVGIGGLAAGAEQLRELRRQRSADPSLGATRSVTNAFHVQEHELISAGERLALSPGGYCRYVPGSGRENLASTVVNSAWSLQASGSRARAGTKRFEREVRGETARPRQVGIESPAPTRAAAAWLPAGSRSAAVASLVPSAVVAGGCHAGLVIARSSPLRGTIHGDAPRSPTTQRSTKS
jgi:hypothetical protein